MVHTGSISINGVNDSELIEILKIKEKHESDMLFNPSQMQPLNENMNGVVKQTAYNNVVLTFHNEDGLKAVLGILKVLTNEERSATTT
jgi:hypothetical protein